MRKEKWIIKTVLIGMERIPVKGYLIVQWLFDEFCKIYTQTALNYLRRDTQSTNLPVRTMLSCWSWPFTGKIAGVFIQRNGTMEWNGTEWNSGMTTPTERVP